MIIHVGNISMQRFLPEHTGMLYKLINNPEVRKGMSNSAEIPYASHLLWVKKNLLEGDRVHLFVVADENHGQGVALIKNISGKSGELGIMVGDITAARKTLLTSKLLTGILYYAFDQLNLQYINICILPGNINSLVTAKKIGAEFQGQDETYQYFLLEKSKYGGLSLNRALIGRYQPVCVG
jgi:RimJ/RimL family protein N-acetyltransferase